MGERLGPHFRPPTTFSMPKATPPRSASAPARTPDATRRPSSARLGLRARAASSRVWSTRRAWRSTRPESAPRATSCARPRVSSLRGRREPVADAVANRVGLVDAIVDRIRPGQRPRLLPLRRRLLVDADRVAEGACGLGDVHAELLAQPADEHLNRIRVAVEILLVQMLDDLAARDDPPGVMHEIRQETIFVAGELDRLAVDSDPPGARGEPDRAHRKIARRVAGGAPHQRPEARQHLLHMKGLGDIIVGAGVDALDLVAPPVAGGQNQDRHRTAGLAPGLQDRDPVALGQADVEHDRIIGLGVAAKPALLAGESAVDRIARRLERGRYLAIEIAIVF